MKKFLLVAVLAAGTMVACNDTSNTVNGVDTTTQAYKDSVAAASGGSMMTSPDTSSSMMTTPSDTSGSMMSSDTSTMMKSDSMPK